MAAHDTTTSTLTSMIYELARRHPEWQERVREECLGYGQDSTVGFDDLDQGFETLTLGIQGDAPPLPASAA